MARAPDPRIEQAKAMCLKGMKLVEIASQLNLPEGTVRSWKNRYKWDCNVAKEKRNVAKRKKGGQPGNQNATGPPENKNAVKTGEFETLFFLYRKDRLRRSLELKNARTEAGTTTRRSLD